MNGWQELKSQRLALLAKITIGTRIKKMLSSYEKRKLAVCWRNMNARCNIPTTNRYEYYGGKGIKISMTYGQLIEIWKRDNACELKKPSIDRIDSNKDYSFENCRFIEFSENVKRMFFGDGRRKTSTDDNLTARMYFRLPSDLLIQAKELARDRKTTVSGLVREYLEEVFGK